MPASDITQTLAVWGAITGTIGTVMGAISLYLRFFHVRRDNPKLRNETVFEFEYGFGDVRPRHRIIVRSVGRRSVTLDRIRYFLQPKPYLHRLLRSAYWRRGRWIHDKQLRDAVTLPEGQKKEFFIELPEGFELNEIRGATVVDQAGVLWPVSWPTPRNLRKLIQNETFHDSEEKNENRQSRVTAFSAGERYTVFVSWNPTPRSFSQGKGHFFHCRSRKHLESTLKKVLEEVRPKILEGQLDAAETTEI